MLKHAAVMPHNLRAVNASPRRNAPPINSTIGIMTAMTGSHLVMISPSPESRYPYEMTASPFGMAPNSVNSARLDPVGNGAKRNSTNTAGSCTMVKMTIDQPSGSPNNF